MKLSTGTYKYPLSEDKMETILPRENGAYLFHCPAASPVLASADGVVVHVTANIKDNYHLDEEPDEHRMPRSERKGNVIILRHKHGEYSRYYHLSNIRKLAVGQEVCRGQELARSGKTGWAQQTQVGFQVFSLNNTNHSSEEGKTIRWKHS